MARRSIMKSMRTWSNKGTHWWSHKYDCISKNHRDYNPEYRVWGTMIRRCTKPSCSMYLNYGGRGIKVCERWSDPEKGFINFYFDMGKRPVDKNGKPYQIDRIDNDGDYCPENCRWVDATTNARNKRNSHYVYINGEKMTVQEACGLFHLKSKTVVENARRHKEHSSDVSNALIRVLEWRVILTKERKVI